MSSSTVMGVLKASRASLHDQLALLPESLHADVLLCAFPNIKAEGTMCLETSLHTTASISTALATVPSLRGLKHLELMGICHSTHARPVFKQLMDALNTAIHDNIESVTLDMESEGSMALLKGVIHCLEMNTAFKCLTLEGGSMEQLIQCEEMQTCASLSKLRGLECLSLTNAHCSTRYQRKAEDRIPAGLQCQTQLTRLQITMVMRGCALAPFLSTLTKLRYLEIACMAESVSEAELLAVALRCMQHLTTLMLTVGSVGMASLMHCHRCPLHEFYVDPSELEDIEAAEGPWDPLFLHPALVADASVDAAGEQNGIHANPAGNAGGSIAPPVAEIEHDAVNELAGMGVGSESAADVVVDSSGPQNHGEGPGGGGGGGDSGADTDGAETAGDAQAAELEQGPFGAAGADNGMQIAVHAMYDDMHNVEMNELNELQQAIEGQMLAGNLEADLHTEIALSDGNYASDGIVCRAVVESIQHLPELQTLHVACRNRHDSTFSDVCSNPVLQSLTSLQSLAIGDTSVGVIRVLDLLPSVAQLTRFSANVLSTSSSRAVVNIRDKLSNLTSLQDFNGCLKLCDDEGILRKGFPVFVGPSGLKELTTFHLGLHEICRDPRFNYSRPTHTETVGSVAAGFMSILKGPEKLQSLSVMFERLNQYRERDAGDPADSLKGVLGTVSESMHLTSLFLDSAAVGDECAKALAQSVRALKSLKCLTCSGTFRDVSALESFCTALGGNAMSSLQILRLNSGVLYEGASIEFFTEPGMESLLSALSSMNKLDSLMIDGYGISDAGMKGLAEAIPGMKSLQHLYLHNCGMTDVAATFLAQHVHHVKTLQSLDLSLNNFSDDGVRVLAGVCFHTISHFMSFDPITRKHMVCYMTIFAVNSGLAI